MAGFAGTADFQRKQSLAQFRFSETVQVECLLVDIAACTAGYSAD